LFYKFDKEVTQVLAVRHAYFAKINTLGCLNQEPNWNQVLKTWVQVTDLNTTLASAIPTLYYIFMALTVILILVGAYVMSNLGGNRKSRAQYVNVN